MGIITKLVGAAGNIYNFKGKLGITTVAVGGGRGFGGIGRGKGVV